MNVSVNTLRKGDDDYDDDDDDDDDTTLIWWQNSALGTTCVFYIYSLSSSALCAHRGCPIRLALVTSLVTNDTVQDQKLWSLST
jgi:hypothetical protein